MEVYIKNPALETIGIVDVYTSIIWTKRYYTAGDFELYLPVSAEMLQLLQIGNYVVRQDDDSVMIIESIQITTDAETGNYLTVSGRSFESVLSRRIIWGQKTVNGQFAPIVYMLIRENAIETSEERIIPGLTIDVDLTYNDLVQAQYTGDNLYDVICELCSMCGYGWKITLENDAFVFRLYRGTDHSYNQSENPYVTFSPEFDNLINSNYQFDKTNYANAALIGGEGEGYARKQASVGTATGLDRYEIFVDANGVSSNADSENPISAEEYTIMLQTEGMKALTEHLATEAFEGEAEETTYVYKEHWNVGDIVQVENEYGVQAAPRILEVIENIDETGRKIIPTWELETGITESDKIILRDSAGYILRDAGGYILSVEG